MYYDCNKYNDKLKFNGAFVFFEAAAWSHMAPNVKGVGICKNKLASHQITKNRITYK
jgi:hypothetical protein